MYRPLSRSQALLAVASVICLWVARPSMAQVQTSAVAFDTEALDLETGMEGELSSAGLSTEVWRAITRYVEQGQYGEEWIVESGSGEFVHEDAKLLASDGAYFDLFGFSVAISGDTVVVGAHYDDDQGGFSGSAYVFEKPDGGWSGTLSQTAKLLASDGAGWNLFGRSVAISGDTVVVGAHEDDDQGSDSGSAYVFEKPSGGWSGILNEDAKLLASDGAGVDLFGYSVTISGDTVVVGAHGDDDQGSSSGSAYVFERPGGGWSGILNEDAKLLASDGEYYDLFGYSVAVSGDTVVVGAWGDDDQGATSGSAYVFEKPSGGWSGILNEDAKLFASDGVYPDDFGFSVAVSGDTVVVGAYDSQNSYSGSAYVFEKPGGGWSGMLSEDAKLLASDGAYSDYFGTSIGISGDTVVVGAFWDDDQSPFSGSAYVFEKPGGGWSGILNEDAKLLASDGADFDLFGFSVAVSGDTVVVGAHGDDDQSSESGSAYVFVQGDSDGDGVPDELDVCADTVIPEGVPTRRLGRNRFALVDDDGIFDTSRPRGGGPGVSFTVEEAGGCSCEQIIAALDLGKGHLKFGCSKSAMETWVDLVNP